MHADDELENWRRHWQAQPTVPLDLRRVVERDIRARRQAMLWSVAVTVVIGGGTLLWAARSAEVNTVVLAIAVWIFIAVAWLVTLQLERLRGPFQPLTDTTAAFLDYAIRTRRARRQGIIASAVLYVALFVFVLVWRYHANAATGPLDPWTYVTSGRVLAMLAISGVLAMLAVHQRRGLARELHNLVTMRDAGAE